MKPKFQNKFFKTKIKPLQQNVGGFAKDAISCAQISENSVRLKGPINWFGGSIRRKLTLFVMLVCFILIALVWLLGVQLLEPAYKNSIKKDLSRQLKTITSTMDTAVAKGVPLISTVYEDETLLVYSLSAEMTSLLDERILSNDLVLANLCIDMSDVRSETLLLEDRMPSSCILHGNSVLFKGRAIGGDVNLLSNLRKTIFEKGTVFYETEAQLTFGALGANGEIAILVSTNLERISQAVSVLRKLMLLVSIVLVAFSCALAFVFSKWFTQPLLRLSCAANEIAKGNYKVNVVASGYDEIAALTHDFNKMAQEVELSANLQKDIIANVSHDLRTPLTLIKGYAETIKDLTGDNPEKRKEQLSVIIDETDRLSALVNSVMELSRVSSGHEKPVKITFSLSQLCEEIAYKYSALTTQQNYNFVYSFADNCIINADPALIERVLQNFLGNAINHVGKDNYIGLSLEIIENEVKALPPQLVQKPTAPPFTSQGKTALVKVVDHGIGIAPEEQERVFERYYRSRANSGKAGTGLGLSITKAILDVHGFSYGVDSEMGKGSVFWFKCPVLPK